MSQGITSASLNSLWNNPQLLQEAFPSINVSGLQGVLESELTQVEAPVQQMSTEEQTLSAQASAYSAVQQALQQVQTDATNLEQASAFAQTGTPVSSDPGAVAASGSGAPAGTYQVSVSSLEQDATVTSGTVAQGADTALGWSGTLTLEVGDPGSQTAVSVNVSSTDTLGNIAQNLSAAAAQSLPSGETLSAFTLPTGGGAQLVMDVNGTLAPAQITTQGTFPGLTFSQEADYAPASYAIDGVANTSNSNTLQNALPGVTLTLGQVTAPGSPVTLQASADPSVTATQVQSMVSDIQSAVATINGYTAQGQALAGDPTLNLAANELLQALTGTTDSQPAGYQSLTDMGVTISYTQGTGGSLTFDTGQFTQALTADPSAVASLFTGTGGLASQIAQVASTFATPNTGILASDQTNIQSQDSLLSDEEGAIQQLITQQTNQLESQFMSNLQTLVNNASQLQFIQAYVAQQSGGSSSSGQGQVG